MTTTTIITTSKGRVQHLARSLPTWLSYTSYSRVVVVDAGCPDGTYDWVDGFRTGLGTLRRIHTFRTLDSPSARFNKPFAQNQGVEFARNVWGTSLGHLLFLDADTLVTADFFPWLRREQRADSLIIAAPDPSSRDLTGVLGVHEREHAGVRGADERFRGWGAEDLDLRLRLYLSRKLRVVQIPPGLLGSIPHGDDLRVKHYAEPDKQRSHESNLQLLVDNVARITGKTIVDLIEEDPMVRTLLGAGIGPMPSYER